MEFRKGSRRIIRNELLYLNFEFKLARGHFCGKVLFFQLTGQARQGRLRGVDRSSTEELLAPLFLYDLNLLLNAWRG